MKIGKEIMSVNANKVINALFYVAVSYAVIDFFKLSMADIESIKKTLLWYVVPAWIVVFVAKDKLSRKTNRYRFSNEWHKKRKKENGLFLFYPMLSLAVIIFLLFAFEPSKPKNIILNIEDRIAKVLTGDIEVKAFDDEGSNFLIENPTRDQIIDYIREVFEDDAEDAIKIVGGCENIPLNSNATNTSNSNGTTDWGVFQINDVHEAYYGSGFKHDWRENVRVARNIQQRFGWSPWACSYMIGVVPYNQR